MSSESTEEITKVRTTRIELVQESCFEETGWSNERRTDGGDCQLDGGSTENLKRSGSKEEETPRGDRE